MKKPLDIVLAITQWISMLALVLVPIFFLPLTQDYYDTNKLLLVVGAAALLLVLTGLRSAITGNLIVSVSPLAIGLASLTAAALISLFTASINRWEALTLSMGPVALGALTIFIAFGSHTISHTAKKLMTLLLEVETGLLAIIAVLQFAGIGKLLSTTVPFLSDALWTPAGSSIALIAILCMVVPMIVMQLTSETKKKSPLAITLGLLLAIVVAGLGVTLWQVVPLITKTFLPIPEAWAMMLEVLKNPRQAVTGVGAENFLSAFTTGRSIALNTSNYLGLRFNLSATFLFHMITTFGFLGMGAALLFIKGLLPQIRPFTIASLSLLIGSAALLLFPPNLTILVTIMVIWLIMHTKEEHQKTIRFPAHLKAIQFGILGIFLFAAGITLYGIGRAYAAELVFYQSLVAANQNKGTDTYNLQIKAIEYNPFISRYHLTYSQTNLAIASAITQGGTTAQPKTLSEQDRQTVTTLIQQSIREAKNATALAPVNVFAWENLARIYQALVGVAQGADTWTVAALQQAVALDPSNPILRLDLGGLYVSQKNYDTALQQFLAAANLKQDFPNAYYNLANVYKLQGSTDKAIAALQTTLTLIKPDTSDYAKAQNELNDLQRQKNTQPATTNTKGEETLTKPPTSNAPIVVPPLNLPESAAPSIPAATPTLTP